MAWPLLVLLLALLFPAWEDRSEPPQEGLAVLAFSGTITGEGPPAPGSPAVCGLPLFDARYDLDAQVVEVTERARPRWTPRLLLVDEVRADDPGSRLHCGPWPALTASREGAMTWTWSLHDHEVSLPVEREGDVLRVDGRILAPGGSYEVPVSFTWEAPWNATYSYEGAIRVEHRGVWPADTLRTLEPLRGAALWRLEGKA